MMWRLFFAVRMVTTPEMAAVIATLTRWPAAVRAVAAGHLHLTLRFLGDTEPELVPALQTAAERAVVEVSPFGLRFRGVGSFKARGRMSVIWIGIEDDSRLQRLKERLEAELATLGLPAELKPYQPHLTIGRMKAAPPAAMRQWLEANRETPCGVVMVNAMELIRSQLTPRGSVYETLATCRMPH